MTISIEDMATFCKKKGFVFRSADIYGGLSGFFDFGPLGVELKNNLKNSWYRFIVQQRENVVAQDGSIITNPKVWEASGHLESFGDLVLACSKCNHKLRADHFIEDTLKIDAETMSVEEVNKTIQDNKLVCPQCKGQFKEAKDFNLLFPTQIGADTSSKSVAYLRGETCQSIFPNFRLIMEVSRQKLPFGIAQIGKAFRNEISPREFLFRQREFEQMELEFFIHPDEKKCDQLTADHKKLSFEFLSAKAQDEKKKDMQTVTIQDLIKNKVIDEWHAYWLAEFYHWYVDVLKIDPSNIRIREHTSKELSHYSSATVDIDYKFPFGTKEIFGLANRGQYDLKQHAKFAKAKLEVLDEATGKKVIPRVIEPSQGLDRIFLAVLYNSYHNDKERGNIVLKLPPSLAPYICAILPLMKNKPELVKKAREIQKTLQTVYPVFYDTSGSVGRRYARQDEVGTPLCITVDFESLEDNEVTIRDRDSTKQIRVPIANLPAVIQQYLCGKEFTKLGKEVN